MKWKPLYLVCLLLGSSLSLLSPLAPSPSCTCTCLRPDQTRPDQTPPILHSHDLQPTHRFSFGRETRGLRLAIGVCDYPVRQDRFGKPRLGFCTQYHPTSDKIWGRGFTRKRCIPGIWSPGEVR